MKKRSVVMGAGVGLLLTAPLVAVFYLAAQTMGTAFPPFDMFDWINRVLPGGLVTFVIETMVSIIRGLRLGETSSTAKLAENSFAVIGMIVTGMVAAAILFAVLRQGSLKSRYLTGLIAGLVVGLPVALISYAMNQTATAAPLVSLVWIVVAFAVWGVALEWVYERLVVVSEPSITPAAVPVAQPANNLVQPIDRRQFLVTLGGATAVITLVGAGLGIVLKPDTTSTASSSNALIPDATNEPHVLWSATHALPNAADLLKPAPGTRPEFTPLANHYRIDINSLPPIVKEADWKLEFSGLVDTPRQFTLNELRTKYEPLDQFVTLACISNPLGGDLTSTQRWTGVSLQKILADMKLKPEATYLKITAADGFDEYVALDTIKNDPRVMLTYAWDGLPLETGHGFPLRIYIPSLYGMKQPKWITTIEAVDHWDEGYWVRRGWNKDAVMQTTSVIDTVAVHNIVRDGQTQKVPVGGIAHAGARGIDKVEIQVDGGTWTAAQLRQPLSETTWVIWRYDWPFQSGDHTFAVRCTEKDGTLQSTDVNGVQPNGATGIFTQQVSV